MTFCVPCSTTVPRMYCAAAGAATNSAVSDDSTNSMWWRVRRITPSGKPASLRDDVNHAGGMTRAELERSIGTSYILDAQDTVSANGAQYIDAANARVVPVDRQGVTTVRDADLSAHAQELRAQPLNRVLHVTNARGRDLPAQQDVLPVRLRRRSTRCRRVTAARATGCRKGEQQ